VSELTDALLHAVDEVCEDFGAIADSVAGPDDVQATTDADIQARNQFLHAFAALMREGIEGGREQREFVMQTAVPALLANGQTTLDMVRGHVAFYMALAPHLLAAIPEHLRDEASTWLALYAADYTRDVVEIALSAEADMP
jgi:hypothetical protein